MSWQLSKTFNMESNDDLSKIKIKNKKNPPCHTKTETLANKQANKLRIKIVSWAFCFIYMYIVR